MLSQSGVTQLSETPPVFQLLKILLQEYDELFKLLLSWIHSTAVYIKLLFLIKMIKHSEARETSDFCN